jgi:hypothetical protein
MFQYGLLNPWRWTDRLPWNVGNQKSTYATSHHRRLKASSTQWWKPEILKMFIGSPINSEIIFKYILGTFKDERKRGSKHILQTFSNMTYAPIPTPKIFLNLHWNYNLGLCIISCTILITSTSGGAQVFKSEDGSSIFIQQTSIKLQHTMSKFGRCVHMHRCACTCVCVCSWTLIVPWYLKHGRDTFLNFTSFLHHPFFICEEVQWCWTSWSSIWQCALLTL